MSSPNYGKDFEHQIKTAIEQVDGADIYRVPDQQSGFYGSKNLCDFMVYKYPYHYYLECKVVSKEHILSFSRITKYQWYGLLEKSKIKGNICGILCWFVAHDRTLFIPIEVLEQQRLAGTRKSIRYDTVLAPVYVTPIAGKKRRIFFDYYFNGFFRDMESQYE